MGRTIMVVGNGEIQEGLADKIDAADIVVRFNDCRSSGKGGLKTDIVAVCNTGRPGQKMITGAEWIGNPCVNAASEIWCTRNPDYFGRLKPELTSSHPDLDDFCDDYSWGFFDLGEARGKTVRLFGSHIHTMLDAELSCFRPQIYVVPSTGLLALAFILNEFATDCDRILLTGFSHEGWQWHPWNAERKWMECHLQAGKLARLAHTTHIPSAFCLRDVGMPGEQ